MGMNMEKNELLRTAAKEFVEKIQTLSTPRELTMVGSVVDNDPYPKDLDLTQIETSGGKGDDCCGVI